MAKRFTRRAILFVTMVINCVAVGLLSMALGTHSWVSSKCRNDIATEGTGRAKFGLFEGFSELTIKTTIKKHYRLVCLESLCMYSAQETKCDRQESLRHIINSSDSARDESFSSKRVKKLEKHFHRSTSCNNGRDFLDRVIERTFIWELFSSQYSHIENESSATSEATLMREEVVIVTILALCLSLLFAVTGAIFGVVNSAMNPYQSITGIPGLYFWNICAALFELIGLICGGILYGQQLNENMLLEDEEEGWTNEGLGHFGYSYWLMLVTVVLHCGNCLLIFLATRRKKNQQHFQAPISNSADTLLY